MIWHPHEVGEFISYFNTARELGWLSKQTTFVKSVNNARFFKVIVCKKNEWVYHEKEIASKYSSTCIRASSTTCLSAPFQRVPDDCAEETQPSSYSTTWTGGPSRKLLKYCVQCSTLLLYSLNTFVITRMPRRGNFLLSLRRGSGCLPYLIPLLRDSKPSTLRWG